MPHNNNVVAAILATASQTAQGRGASREAIVLGIIAALRRLHIAVQDASESMSLAVRATIRDIIIARNLERRRASKTTPEPASLPPGRESDRAATAIFEDAANSCLALNALVAGNECIDIAVRFLTERLIATLGAPPDYAKLVDRITGAAGEGSDLLAWRQPTAAFVN